VSQLVHATNAIAFYFVARRLLAAARDGGRQAGRADPAVIWGAATAALVFAVHPLRVESVAWVTERRDVLSGFFFLTAVLAYLRAVEARDRPAPPWIAGSLALFAAGLLSKASIMALPAALVLLDVYPLRRGAFTWRHLVVEKAGHWIVGGAGALGALVASRSRASGSRATGCMARRRGSPWWPTASGSIPRPGPGPSISRLSTSCRPRWTRWRGASSGPRWAW